MQKDIPMKPSKPNLHDCIAAAAVLALAALALLFGGTLFSAEASSVTVTCDGTVYGVYTLKDVPEEGTTLTVQNRDITLHIHLERNGVSVSGADCPGQDCVKTGKIEKAGQSIVCLPGRIVISLSGGDAEFDFYVG